MTEYTATTANATNTVKATASDSRATVTLTLDDALLENGAAATWADGPNTVKVLVVNGDEQKTYTVVVTKATGG